MSLRNSQEALGQEGWGEALGHEAGESWGHMAWGLVSPL